MAQENSPSISGSKSAEAADPKAAQCGMFLTHNGGAHHPKAQVREGVEGLGEVRRSNSPLRRGRSPRPPSRRRSPGRACTTCASG